MPIEQSRDPEKFAAFELSGWEANIRGYDSAFGAVARQTVQPMLDAARVIGGMEVLDICCGPGILAAGALQGGARSIGLDFSGEAVELARRLVPKGHFRQGDAQALPFPAASFDAVVYEAVRARGNMDVALPHGPDFFQFGLPNRMQAALTEAGFSDAAAYTFDQSWHVANADRYVEAILTGTVRARAVLAAQSEATLAGVRSYIANYLTRFRTSAGELAVPMPAIVGSGARLS